jgi:hypothetical protein
MRPASLITLITDFAGKQDLVTKSLSGYGLSVHGGLRLEFFRHFFVQTDFSGGFMHQIHVRTRAAEHSAFAHQKCGDYMLCVILKRHGTGRNRAMTRK